MQPHAEIAVLREPLPAWAVAALIHVASTVASLALAAGAPDLAPGAAWCWLEGVGAAVIGVMAGLPLWWLPINLLFVPAAHALLGWQVPAPLYLAAFGVLFAVNVAAWRHRVPLFLSSAKVPAALWALLPRHAGFRLLDLGCGTGSLLGAFAHARPDGHYHGIETAPFSYLVSRWRARSISAVSVAWGDFWRADFAQYDVVYAYLSPQPMARLWQKARREMRPGSLLVSNTFAVPGVEPAYVLPVGDRLNSTLFVWRM